MHPSMLLMCLCASDACDPVMNRDVQAVHSLPSMLAILAPLDKRRRLTGPEPEDVHLDELLEDSGAPDAAEEVDYDEIISAAAAAMPYEEDQEEPAPAPAIGLEQLKEQAAAHLLSILNTADFTALTSLRGIGKARATALLTHRNTGNRLTCLEELEEVGMSEGAVRRFVLANLGSLLA